MRTLFILNLAALFASSMLSSGQEVTPLLRAHSHNDYEHQRPLLDALDSGFCSIEADIYLIDGKLLVAHDRNKTKPDKTLESLYLDPLKGRAEANGGRIYPGGPEVSLLIDLKTPWAETYPALRQVLARYSSILTRFENGQRKQGAVLVVLSGSRSKKMFDGESVRYAAFDGQISDLDGSDTASLIPWISANWEATFKSRSPAEMTAPEAAKLNDIVSKAHSRGMRVRFWGAPDNPEFWKFLLDHKVDLINTDHLKELRSFLLQNTELKPK